MNVYIFFHTDTKSKSMQKVEVLIFVLTSNWNCVPWKQVVLAAVLDLKSKPVIPTASWQGVRH